MITRKGTYSLCWPTVALAFWCLTQCGCAVPQRPGKGYCSRLVEPQTHTGYWLYLPQDYVENRGKHPAGDRWPLVVTFHGLRPYDDANPQIREWQAEADRYNFIVIAPELRTCDSLYMQFPLVDPDLPYVKKDEQAILSVMDEVTRRTDADPARVLATSFSSGGYMAHYMVNRHPERFSCLAVRGSNFSESLLDPGQIPKYRSMKIGIFFGENDFKPCRDESLAAVDWYRRHRFDVTAKKVSGLGHERKPEIAAALFAGTIGVNPKTPPDLGPLVMMDVAPSNHFRWSTRREIKPAPRTMVMGSEEPVRESAAYSPSPAPALVPVGTTKAPAPAPQAAPTVQVAPSTTRTVPRKVETPKRPTGPDGAEVGKAPRSPERTRSPLVFAKREQVSFPPIPASIRLHGEPVGRAPMWVSLSVELPENLRDGVTVLWTDNGRPIPSLNIFETQTVLNDPGDHELQAHIITADDRKAVLQQTVTVLGPATQPAS